MNSKQAQKGTLSRAAYDALLRHLARERDWQQSARDSLLVVRRSAVLGDVTQLDAALRHQHSLVSAQDELATARQSVLTQAAEQLGIRQRPATLTVIAGRLSPEARLPIVSVRRELAGGARGLRELSRGAMAIIVQKRQIVDGILGDLLGAAPTESRYAADGHRQDSPTRALVECRS
ncbi:MAG: hypothetical protein JNG89_06200 [Planctomycetaceae bacterium]|nr:hypothetical protein [Planctomycetaceae bacterium]